MYFNSEVSTEKEREMGGNKGGGRKLVCVLSTGESMFVFMFWCHDIRLGVFFIQK